MPKIVRNFWVKAHADGLTKVGTGPRAGDGGMDIELFQRSAGEVTDAADIRCRWLDGTLRTTIRLPEGAALIWPDGQRVELHRDTEVEIVTSR